MAQFAALSTWLDRRQPSQAQPALLTAAARCPWPARRQRPRRAGIPLAPGTCPCSACRAAQNQYGRIWGSGLWLRVQGGIPAHAAGPRGGAPCRSRGGTVMSTLCTLAAPLPGMASILRETTRLRLPWGPWGCPASQISAQLRRGRIFSYLGKAALKMRTCAAASLGRVSGGQRGRSGAA